MRLRTPWEAIDLGFRLLAANYWRVVISFFIITLPVVILLNVSMPENAGLIFWWLKPLFAAAPLFVLSRALFDHRPALATTLTNWPRMVWRRCLWWLTLGRLDPARSFHLPITHLEGLSGSARRQRARALRRRDFHAGVFLTIGFLLLEMGVIAGLYCISIMASSPIGVDMQLVQAALGLEQGYIVSLIDEAWTSSGGNIGFNVFWYAAILLLEPFYVAAGFCLYLNRRSWLEGWDIEISFRQLQGRLLERQRWQQQISNTDSSATSDAGAETPNTNPSTNPDTTPPLISPRTSPHTSPSTRLKSAAWLMLGISAGAGLPIAESHATPIFQAEQAELGEPVDLEPINQTDNEPNNNPETSTDEDNISLPAPDDENFSEGMVQRNDGVEDGPDAAYCRELSQKLQTWHQSDDAIDQALAKSLGDPEFGKCSIIEKREPVIKPDEEKEEDTSESWWDQFWDWLFGSDDDATEPKTESKTKPAHDDSSSPKTIQAGLWTWFLYGGLIVALIIIVWLVLRRFYGPNGADSDKNAIPNHRFTVGDEIVDTRTLPKNAAEKAAAQWANGAHRDALSLLYRATLGELVVRHHVIFPDSATEQECLQLARDQAPPPSVDYLTELTLQWQLLAYAHRQPDDAVIAALCERWAATLQSKASVIKEEQPEEGQL